MQPVKDQHRYVLLTASLRFLLSLCLLAVTHTSCKKAADVQPDWATGVVGTYKGKIGTGGTTATVLVTREDNALITVTLTETRTYTYNAVFTKLTMTSATALSGKGTYSSIGGFYCGDGSVQGSFGGASLSLAICGGSYIFTGNK